MLREFAERKSDDMIALLPCGGISEFEGHREDSLSSLPGPSPFHGVFSFACASPLVKYISAVTGYPSTVTAEFIDWGGLVP
jgi:hypothetical protein